MISIFFYAMNPIDFLYLLEQVLLTLSTILPFLVSVSILVMSERKVLAALQKRQGPTYVGLFGIFQCIADGFKLIFKELIIPHRSNSILFSFFPIFSFTVSFSC